MPSGTIRMGRIAHSIHVDDGWTVEIGEHHTHSLAFGGQTGHPWAGESWLMGGLLREGKGGAGHPYLRMAAMAGRLKPTTGSEHRTPLKRSAGQKGGVCGAVNRP